MKNSVTFNFFSFLFLLKLLSTTIISDASESRGFS